ncbi:TraU family protein [Vibrio sp. Makdt]|uniref:TraU family protein n=1 Tax=Vibrio sp. Makdt TaxID=2998828 RepID=UPI0022CD5743|nr:TraU family protein [Vibrio sp. Makdt]MDA0152412.1 TraU family protein [Vibrio sp. Makdt]
MKSLVRKITVALASATLLLSGASSAGGMDSQCPDSEYFTGLMTDICWTCALPISLFGLTDPPEGANDDFMCACDDDLGIPIPGFAVGFYQPDQIMEVSTIPYCSPTLGGVQLSNDYTHIGTSLDDKSGDDPNSQESNEKSKLVQYHYNYLASPVLKMMQVLAIPECDKTPGTVDLDIMFMSPLTVEWYDDLMSFVLNPDAVAFANPVGQAMCMYDCAETMLTGEASQANWHCAGCDGSLYPLTGNISGAADNPIQATSLVTQRAIAKSHRLGLSALTMGKDAMCKYKYTPMLPKSQYKFQMAFPSAQASGSCCQPLGENWLKWGLGRTSPGGGEDTTFVYNIFRWADCCIPLL